MKTYTLVVRGRPFDTVGQVVTNDLFAWIHDNVNKGRTVKVLSVRYANIRDVTHIIL